MEWFFAGQQLWQRRFRIANPPTDDFDVQRIKIPPWTVLELGELQTDR